MNSIKFTLYFKILKTLIDFKLFSLTMLITNLTINSQIVSVFFSTFLENFNYFEVEPPFSATGCNASILF